MIYFIRHGLTDNNINKITSGRLDVPLNQTGINQAVETANALKDIHFDICFCSPLLRAKQTLNEILKFHEGLEVIYDERVIEREYGELSGKSLDSYTSKFNKWDENAVIPDSVESISSIYDRVHDFYEYVKQNYADKNVLVVSHSGVGRVSHAYFYGKPENGDYYSIIIDNAKIIKFDFN